VEQGNHGQLIQKNGVYAELLRLHETAYRGPQRTALTQTRASGTRAQVLQNSQHAAMVVA
jgi:hypothetical protein